MKLFWAVALTFLSAGCTCSPLAIDKLPYRCVNNDECGEGFGCTDSVCRAMGSDAGSDGGRPDGGRQDGGFDAGFDAGCGTQELCDNEADDTCDGLADCNDPTCSLERCGASGRFCGADAGPCECSGNGGVAQTSESSCADTFDNDCNGLTDCADPNCLGRSCDTVLTMTCQQDSCRCLPDAGVAGDAETVCDNRKDDNCNGLVDCAESSCDGKACSLTGSFCVSQVCTCIVPGGSNEPSEVTCNDLKDNDCDGLADCQEIGCNGKVCGENGLACSGDTCACSGNGGMGQVTESRCGDGFDNDCDTLVDCADPQCDAVSCSVQGKVCQNGACTCTAQGGIVEVTETLCSDGKDNDCNGFTDCGDPTCNGIVCGGVGKVCQAKSCVCQVDGGTPEVSESICGDGLDNDCDGAADCDDPSCNNVVCSTTNKRCSANMCICTGGGGSLETSETICNDGKDNDCDGLTDCDDPSCANKRCAVTGPSKGMCCAGRGCVDISTEIDCSGCGLECPATQRCVLTDAVKGAYRCACNSAHMNCPMGTSAVQVCENTSCNCTPSNNMTSGQCAPDQICDLGKFCTFKP